MRILVLLVLVAAARAAPVGKNLLPWDEWGQDLHITGPVPDRHNVCFSTTRDGRPMKVCCEGYSGSVEEGCPTPVCPMPCQNGGSCGAPNHCVCTKAFTGETCTDMRKEFLWSTWVNLDTVNVNGDTEELYLIRQESGMCKNSVPQAIECRTTAGIDHTMIGQVLTCDRRVGLRCSNNDQPDGVPCLDYEVRILCPIKDEITKLYPTCIHSNMEYEAGEKIKDGDCLACTCDTDGHWECYQEQDYCNTPMSTTPPPTFAWLPVGVDEGQCIVGETVFNHGENTTLDCKKCTCHSTMGWICTPTTDTTCMAPSVDDYCRIENHFIFFHGQTTKKDCNTCICKNSEWECTQTICPDMTQKLPYYFQCINPETNQLHNDGEIVTRDCNVCVCTQNKWDCTRDPCQEGTAQDDNTQLALLKVCTLPTGIPFPHGTTINQDCNVCKCFNGLWSCSRRYCSPETYPNSTCVDEVTTSLVKSGQTIHRGCDICLCNSGNLTCTTKPCNMKTGICFDEQHRYVTTSTSFSKQYRPSCNQDGTFQPIQCNPLHGVCFCVTTFGQVIPGTAVRQGTASPNCSPYTFAAYDPLHITMPEDDTTTTTGTYPCIQTNMDTTTQLMTGYNTPRCLANGYFAPLQCNAHLGLCYCVTRQGTTIPGTMLHVSQGRPNCEVLREDTSTVTGHETLCEAEQTRADQYKLPFRPVCDQDGQFRPLQVNPLSGVHFCVDRHGAVLEWTITQRTTLNCNAFRTYVHREFKPFTTTEDSERTGITLQTFPIKDLIHKTPRCLLQQEVSRFVPTVYRPTCEPDGRFEPRQCPGGTGVCFCVDATGAKVPQTTRPVAVHTPDCYQYRSVHAVLTPWNTTTVMVHPKVSLTHSGWDPELINMEHPNHLVGKQHIPTTTPTIFKTNATACIRQQQIAALVPGVFFPSCLRNGSFSTLQHHPLTPTVYCVDKNGIKIEGTETTVNDEQLPDCTQYWNTTVDMTKAGRHWSNTPQDTMTTEPILLDWFFPAGLHHHPNCTKQQEITSRTMGAAMPSCEPNGTYTPLQCNATTGVCYCMLPYGDVLPDTVWPLVKGTPNCWHLTNTSMLQKTTPVSEVCKKPMVRGPCKSYLIRWGYSKLLNKCHLFIFGGCRGNENQFQTKEECEQTCGYLNIPTDTGHVSCQRKLSQFNRLIFTQRLTTKRPQCTPEGNYRPKQCRLSRAEDGQIREVCDCVDTMTGQVLETCETETRMHKLERVILSTTPAPKIDGCISEEVEYHQGDEFFKDCNDCICIGNNEAACTLMYCIPGVCYHNGEMAEQYERGCEVCDCVGGRWDCIRKPNCSPDQRPVPYMDSATHCALQNGKTMRIGAYYYDECNQCLCESNGLVTCDTKYCIPRHCYHEGKPFHDDQVVKKDCNKCTCFGGHWDCQNYTCDPIIRTMIRLEGCEYNGKKYPNGETFFDKCNLCHCLGNNATSCFKKPCNPESCYLDGVEIVNGESIPVDCNTCTCYRGMLGCTLMACMMAAPEPEPQPEVNFDPSITCYFEGMTYTNGQEFWKDCNFCRCYDNGEATCEETVCTPDRCYVEGVGYMGGKVLLSETQKCTCFRGGYWDCVDKPEDTGPPDVIECPAHRPPIYCPTNPCDSTICPSQAAANPICVPDYCGHCLPAFFDVHGNQLRC